MEGVEKEVSNEVDKRIIEMEFKNEEFEKNASKTLNTLDALKAKLNNNFSTKAAERLNESIKAVDVSPIAKGIDMVQYQFNALQIAGKRVIENIVDSAMRGIADVKNKLMGVVNQIKVGGANRAQNIEQAKFMLEGFGIQWSQIEEDISFGVQDTAYGLDAAAKVASQLVASNVSLGDDMKHALLGISGVAAMTNSTYEDIGRIFTQVAGQGRVMGDQLLQLSGRGLNVAAELAKTLNVTEADVRQMTSKGQIDFKTFSEAMYNAFGPHAKEANKTFTGVLSNTRAALSRLGADIQAQKFEVLRQLLSKVIPKLKELKTALKPVEESIKTAMEAFGKLAEYLVDRINVTAIIEAVTPKITHFMSLVTEFANTAREYIQKLDGSKPTKFIQNVKEAAEVVKKITDATKEEIDMAKRIWNVGDIGNGEERVKNLEALGFEYSRVQGIVDAFIDSNYDWDAAVKQTTNDLNDGEKAVNGFIGPLNENKKPTTIYLIVDALFNLSKIIKNVVGSAINIASVVKDTFKEVFTPRGIAGQVNTFAGILGDISDKLYVTKGDVEQFKPLITFIFSTMKALAKVLLTLGKWALIAANKVAQIFNTIRNSKIVNTILTTIGKCIQVIIEKMKIVFGYLRDSGILNKFINILKYIALWLGDKLVNAFIFLANHAGDVFIALGKGFGNIVEKVENLIVKMEEAGGITQILKDFFTNGVEVGKSWITKIGDKITSLFGGDGETKESIFTKAYEKASAFGHGLLEGINSITFEDLKDAGGLVAKIVTVVELLQFLSSVTGLNKGIKHFFKSMGDFFDSLSSLTASMAHKNNASAIESLARSVALIVGSIIALSLLLSKLPNSEEVVNKAVKLVKDFVILIGVFEVIMIVAQKTKAAANAKKISITLNARKLAMATIMTALATFMMSMVSLIKFTTKGMENDESGNFAKSYLLSIVIISAILVAMVAAIKVILKAAEGFKGSQTSTKALENVAKVIKAISNAVVKIALIIVVLTAAFSLFDDPDAFNQAITTFIATVLFLLIAIEAVLISTKDMSKEKADALDMVTNYIMIITASITLLMGAIALLTVVFSKTPTSALVAMGIAFAAIIGALVGMLILTAKLKIGDITEFNSKMNALIKIGAVISLLLGAFSALALSLGAMKQMGVSFKELFLTLVSITAMVTLIVGIGGLVSLIPGAATGLAALSGVLAGFGVAMIGIAASILSLALAFKIIIEVLPRFVSAFETFHNQILDKKDVVVAGIGDLIGVIAQGLLVGFIQALNALINNMGPVVDALIDTIIVFCSVLGGALKNRASELGDAIALLVEGIVVVIVDALVGAIKGIILGVWDAIKELRDKVFGSTDLAYEDDGSYKDALAEAYVQRTKSGSSTDAEKAAYKHWLKENGYDENGQRTSSWTATTTISIERAYEFVTAPATKTDEYAARYGGDYTMRYEADEANASKEAAKGAEENASKLSGSLDKLKDSFGGSLNKANDISVDAEAIKEKLSTGALNVNEGVGNVTDMFGNLGDDITNEDALGNLSDVIGDEAEETATNMDEYNDIVNKKTKILSDAILNMANTIRETLQKLSDDSKDIGVKVVDGFVSGMSNMAAVVKLQKASKVVGETVKETMEKVLDIHSPSRVMEKLGDYTIVGFANGITNSIGVATSATQEAGESAILSMRETIKRLSLEAAEGLDNSPRITPILDMSNVTDGINSINGMFDTTHAIRLAGITSTEASNATSRRLGAIYQNGSNFDDTNTVNAITSLQGEIATLKDNINGMQVVIDSRALVGQIATPMDKALGRKALAGRRGS